MAAAPRNTYRAAAMYTPRHLVRRRSLESISCKETGPINKSSSCSSLLGQEKELKRHVLLKQWCLCVCVCENKKIVSTHRTTNTGNCTLARNAVASSPPPLRTEVFLPTIYTGRSRPGRRMLLVCTRRLTATDKFKWRSLFDRQRRKTKSGKETNRTP